MDVARVLLALSRGYVILLLALAAVILVYLVLPAESGSPYVSGLWFALGGFGLLVALTIGLVQYLR